MYSHDIDNTIKINNYNIDSQTYLQILNDSPQIDHVKRVKDNEYDIWTNDGYYWRTKLFLKEN